MMRNCVNVKWEGAHHPSSSPAGQAELQRIQSTKSSRRRSVGAAGCCPTT